MTDRRALPPHGAKPDGAASDHRWFAAFLCLLGLLLYVAAIAGANWVAPGSQESAVLFWNVEPSRLPPNPGLLPMVIAAGLVAAFGLIYPQVVRSGDEQSKGFLEKLVAPACRHA